MTTLLSLPKIMFNRHWWWKTLIVIAAMIFMAGLGNWQLLRLDQRRAYNAELLTKLASDPIVVDGSALPEEPAALVDRRAIVQGNYDFAGQVAIKNQSYMGQPGVHLVTPFYINGSDRAILVNRGWVPYQEGTSDRWGQFDEPATQVTLNGYLQRSQKMPDGSTTTVGETPQESWFRLDIEAIQTQIDAPLMPVYFDLAPEEGRLTTTLPVRIQPETEITEGSHMSYAIQWYAFALIAGIVYVGVVRRQERERTEPTTASESDGVNTQNPVTP